ncbi:MAG: cobyrinate a,c-diamide synthase [Desulfobacterales bacterium]
MVLPRLMISALRGGSGKTILSIGVIAALCRRGHIVLPFKKGPDYIDAGWLALAAGRPCFNLDTFMVPATRVLSSFLAHSSPQAIAVIEGNRGLFDGIDVDGTTSSAELAKLLQTPVLMCIDATKTTRTAAAVVAGCEQFDRDVALKGVILNRVAGARHETILRQSIETHCGVPVIGAVPKLSRQNFPERHMGLVPTPEHGWARDSIDAIAAIVENHIDMAALIDIATCAPALRSPQPMPDASDKGGRPSPAAGLTAPRIGIIRDSAFQFYYPENIAALSSAGADIVFFSPLATDTIPNIDGLYIGGGFPETHAEALAQNVRFREKLKRLAEGGLPIYAECGGLMYLGKELVLDDRTYPMAGVLPISYGFSKRPQGHGYTVIAVDRPNPYFAVGSEYRGHEFHYSRVLEWGGQDADLVFRMRRGAGIWEGRDGACRKNVLATYTHLHALGAPSWAEAVVHMARSFRQGAAAREESQSSVKSGNT